VTFDFQKAAVDDAVEQATESLRAERDELTEEFYHCVGVASELVGQQLHPERLRDVFTDVGNLVDALRARMTELEAGLAWTTERPTEPGAYAYMKPGKLPKFLLTLGDVPDVPEYADTLWCRLPSPPEVPS